MKLYWYEKEKISRWENVVLFSFYQSGGRWKVVLYHTLHFMIVLFSVLFFTGNLPLPLSNAMLKPTSHQLLINFISGQLTKTNTYPDKPLFQGFKSSYGNNYYCKESIRSGSLNLIIYQKQVNCNFDSDCPSDKSYNTYVCSNYLNSKWGFYFKLTCIFYLGLMSEYPRECLNKIYWPWHFTM